MARKPPLPESDGDVLAPPSAGRQTLPAGMVECITTRPCWQGGQDVPVGTPVLLSVSDATYAQSIGRVRRVPDAQETESP